MTLRQNVCARTLRRFFFKDYMTYSNLPYFFGYKTELFPPRNLDPSYKTDIDLWDCLGRVKFVL